MRSSRWVLAVVLGGLAAGGCGDPVAWERAERERRAAEQAEREAARGREVEERLAAGRAALDAGRFEDAVAYFGEVVRLRGDPADRALLAQAEKGRDEARQAAYEAAVLRGREAQKRNAHPAAVSAFHEALTLRPGDPAAAAALREAEFHDALTKGRAALAAGRYREAVADLGRAADRRPDDPTARDLLAQARARRRAEAVAQGKAAAAAKNYSDAVVLFTEARRLGDDAEVGGLLADATFQAKLQLGRQRVGTKQFAAALPHLEEAAKLRPDHPEARALLQEAKDGKKKQDEEKRKKEQDEYDRHLAAGKSALSSKKYDDAVREFRKAKQALPDQAEAGRLLSDAEGKKRDYDRHLTSGKSDLRANRYDDAILHLKDAERLEPFGGEASRLVREAEDKKRQAAVKKR